MTNQHEGQLELERLALAARSSGSAALAVRAVEAAEALAQNAGNAHGELAASALALRLEFRLDFKPAFFAVARRLDEVESLSPLRKKAHRRNLAAMASRLPDDHDLARWQSTADLTPTEDELG